MSPSIFPWCQEKQRFQEFSTKLAQNQRCFLNFAERHAVVLLHEARQAQHLVFRAELAFRSVTISTCLANCHQIVINLITCVCYNKRTNDVRCFLPAVTAFIAHLNKFGSLPKQCRGGWESGIRPLSLSAVSRCIRVCHVCSVLVQNKKSLLMQLIWTNAFVLRNKHGATHWLTNCGGMRQWAVWKRQTLLAVCASSMAYCPWTRPAVVFPTTKEHSEFPKRRYWNSSMTWSEIDPKGKRSNYSSVGVFQPTILS